MATPQKQDRCTRRRLLEWMGGTACASVLGVGNSLGQTHVKSAGQTCRVERTSGNPPLTDSDVGSLFPFIEKQAREKDFPLSFLNPAFSSVGEWKPKARGKLLELLHYSPLACSPDPQVVEKRDAGDYLQEKIYFNTTPELRIPAYVLIPKNLKKPAPAIVALHDHGGFYFWGKEKLVEMKPEPSILTEFKAQYYSGKSIASELARQGYVVIVIDMFYWGERRLILDKDPPDWQYPPVNLPSAERIRQYNQRSSQKEELVGRTIYAAGFTWAGVMYWDDIRTVDYLVTRPEVDPQRIGCVGLSMGCLRSAHLAALDDRIKVAVMVGWMTSFPAQLRRHINSTIGFTKLVPGLYQQMDYPDIASLAVPAAILVINGSKDALFALKGVGDSFQKLQAVYQKAGVENRCRTKLYETPHEFNSEMQAEAWDWLSKWI